LNDAGYWLISLQDVVLNNKSLAITSQKVAIDTGTSLIGAPTTAVNAIFSQIEGSRPADDPNRKGFYYVSDGLLVIKKSII
jgi:cathepsin D